VFLGNGYANKSISTGAHNFVVGRGILKTPIGPSSKLGPGFHTGAPKTPAPNFCKQYENRQFVDIKQILTVFIKI
jgi:hypothetical protein